MQGCPPSLPIWVLLIVFLPIKCVGCRQQKPKFVFHVVNNRKDRLSLC